MRMYKAMRLGAMAWPQAFLTAKTIEGARCARLSALHAIGKEWEDGFDVENRLAGPVVCPCCNDTTQIGSVAGVIVHLNDEHRWTREQIADWLEPIEEAFYAEQEKEEAHALAR